MCQEQAGGSIQVIDRAVTLMQAIAAAPRERTAQELAGACGLNRTTAWRILDLARAQRLGIARPRHTAL